MDDFYENLTALTDNLSDIVFSRYAEVTKVDGFTVECKENESGVVHIDVPLVNNFEVEVGDFVILGFVDNDLYNPIALGMLEPRGGGGGELPIVTEWEQVLSDEKVPSEKLTKDTIDTKVDKETGKGLSTNDYTTEEKEKLAGIENGANKTTVDTALSTSSTNPVQNKVVKGALDLKADTSSLSTVATTGDYDDLVDKPNLATVATTGDYDDLSDKPVIDSALSNTSTNALQNKTIYSWLTVKADKSSLATVATTGDYDDLMNKLEVVDDLTSTDTGNPLSAKQGKTLNDTKVDKVTGKGLSTEDYTTAEKTKLAGIEAEANKIVVDDDLSSTSMNPLTNRRTYRWLTLKADKSSLSTVATSGSYNDLTDKPSIPSKTSDLTNDGDGTNPFLTQHQSLSGYLKTTDIVDDLTTEDSTKPLSAKQGKILKDSITPLNVWTTVYENYGCKLKVNTVLGEAQLEVFSAVNITTANTDIGIATITDSYMPPQTMRVVAHNVVTAVTILIFTPEGKLYVRSTNTGSKTVNGVFRYVY